MTSTDDIDRTEHTEFKDRDTLGTGVGLLGVPPSSVIRSGGVLTFGASIGAPGETESEVRTRVTRPVKTTTSSRTGAVAFTRWRDGS